MTWRASLKNVVYEREDNWNPEFRERLVKHMREAMEQLECRKDDVLKGIDDLSDHDLTKHGLKGRELVFKFAVITLAYKRDDINVDNPHEYFFGWRRLIDALDALLDSILAATGSGSSIKELKDFIALSVVGPYG